MSLGRTPYTALMAFRVVCRVQSLYSHEHKKINFAAKMSFCTAYRFTIAVSFEYSIILFTKCLK